jgi:hypothetical protein
MESTPLFIRKQKPRDAEEKGRQQRCRTIFVLSAVEK